MFGLFALAGVLIGCSVVFAFIKLKTTGTDIWLMLHYRPKIGANFSTLLLSVSGKVKSGRLRLDTKRRG